jgi:hypothetical protein
MFISGNFSEENLRNKVFEGIDLFKKLTVTVVKKGLEIRVDRQSLIENYDKFAVNVLELIREVLEKSEGNIHSFKKKSKDLYLDVVKKIRAKERELKTQLNKEYPQLAPPKPK